MPFGVTNFKLVCIMQTFRDFILLEIRIVIGGKNCACQLVGIELNFIGGSSLKLMFLINFVFLHQCCSWHNKTTWWNSQAEESIQGCIPARVSQSQKQVICSHLIHIEPTQNMRFYYFHYVKFTRIFLDG